MAEMEKFKEILKSEMAPVLEKLKRLETNFEELSASYSFISKQYDELVKQCKSANEKIASLNKTVKEMKKDVESNKFSLFEVDDEIEEMAQYMRRDCLEISGVKPNANFSSEAIVVSIAKALDLDINESDISIAHPLPTYNSEALAKIIVKFTRRNVRNALYGKRKALAELKPSQRPDLNGFIVGENIYISESLTERRKKLYGAVNRFRKSIKWKFIWSQNGRIYIRKDKTAKELRAFDHERDLDEFKKRFQRG